MITFKIEKETKWDFKSAKSTVKYWVWADLDIIGCANNENDANTMFEKAMQNYVKNKTEIIREEIIREEDFQLPSFSTT